jgi:hypothetical protein
MFCLICRGWVGGDEISFTKNGGFLGACLVCRDVGVRLLSWCGVFRLGFRLVLEGWSLRLGIYVAAG